MERCSEYRSYGKLADEIHMIFKILKIEIIDFWLHLINVQHYYSCANAFKLVFWLKPIVRWFSIHVKMLHSLLIPTNKYYRT